MHLLNMPEIKELSIPEKILFVEDLWESIAADASVVQMLIATKMNYCEDLRYLTITRVILSLSMNLKQR